MTPLPSSSTSYSHPRNLPNGETEDHDGILSDCSKCQPEQRQASLGIRDRLVVFLYVLMRDALPSGTVEQIMENHVEASDLTPSFSNPHLEAHARELAARLRKQGSPDVAPQDALLLAQKGCGSVLWIGNNLHNYGSEGFLSFLRDAIRDAQAGYDAALKATSAETSEVTGLRIVRDAADELVAAVKIHNEHTGGTPQPLLLALEKALGDVRPREVR